ncbi:F-box/LRR-repeat protein [Trifolium repens]|nr:F-box/LRR-repeat protein [Trifolium repens]
MKRNSLNSETQTTIAPNLYLPDDCWQSIFKLLINNKNTDNNTDDNNNNNRRYLHTLSVVSKQFLSVTNRLPFSLKITHSTLLPFLLPRLFHRFQNLTSLDLTSIDSKSTDLDALLNQISTFSFNLKSLKLSNQSTIPTNGLRALSKKITTLTSLSCSGIESLRNNDIILISNCFPFLEELDVSNVEKRVHVVVNAKFLKLPKLRKVNLSGHYYLNDSLLLHLCKSCEFLEEIVMLNSPFVTIDHIASAIRERPSLRSLSFTKLMGIIQNYNFFYNSLVSLKGLTCLDLSYSYVKDELLLSIAEKDLPLRRLILQGCYGYGYAGIFNLLYKCRFLQYLDLQNADFFNDWHFFQLSLFLRDLVYINISKCRKLTNIALFALLKNCASLSEVRMEYTHIGIISGEDSSNLKNLVVNHQLKSLYLANNMWLMDKDINMLVSACPNLQLLDLSSCDEISEKCIGKVLRKGSKIRHLNLACCLGLKLHRVYFNISTLEVLNLSESRIDDRSLYAISTGCLGLLQLDLGHCYDITEKGVMQVVENCTQLREINLQDCLNVASDVVELMIFIRPSLKKITAPPFYNCNDKRKLFLRQGCLVC